MTQAQEIPDSWEVKEGTYDGNVLLIRKNSGLTELKSKDSYKIRTGIAFKFNTPTVNGLPDQNETALLNQLEDDIFDSFQNGGKAVVSVIITTDGFREYVIYSKDNDWSTSCFNSLSDKYSSYDLTTYNEFDEDWSVYNEY